MKRRLVIAFLSDSLLLCFALAWLLLIFVPILVAPDNYMGIWYEDNPVILGLEVGVCIFAVIWAAIRIGVNLKKGREHYDKT